MIFDMYGVREKNLNKAMQTLSSLLACSFILHEDDFLGDYFLAHSDDWQEQLRLKDNFNTTTNAWDAPNFREYPLLLEISGATAARAQEINRQLTRTRKLQTILIQHREYLAN